MPEKLLTFSTIAVTKIENPEEPIIFIDGLGMAIADGNVTANKPNESNAAGTSHVSNVVNMSNESSAVEEPINTNNVTEPAGNVDNARKLSLRPRTLLLQRLRSRK